MQERHSTDNSPVNKGGTEDAASPLMDSTPCQSAAFARVRVVLSHTSHPGNIGAAARAIKTMGLSRLYLINPKHFPDPQADARATGALDILQQAQVCSSLAEALAGTARVAGLSARRRGLSPNHRYLRQAAPELAAVAENQEVALLFGTEMSGLSNEELESCHVLLSIPTNPGYSSLNLGSAVQLVAYELRLAMLAENRPPALAPPELARNEDVERFYEHLERTLLRTEFLNPRHSRKLMPRLRRLFNRAHMEKEEVNILRGILTSVDESIVD